MKLLNTLVISSALMLSACGGSDDAPISADQQVLNLIKDTNAVLGVTVRPADDELPLAVILADDSQAVANTYEVLEAITFGAGFIVVSQTDQAPAMLTISYSANSCGSSAPNYDHGSKYAGFFYMGPIDGKVCASAQALSYKFLGLKRGEQITARDAIADRAIATLYNNPPGTKLEELTLY